MKFTPSRNYSIKTLLNLARQFSDDLEYQEKTLSILTDKLLQLPAYELCNIAIHTTSSILQKSALEALSLKDLDHEMVELSTLKQVLKQMDSSQIWKVASPNRNTVVGTIAREYLLLNLNLYDRKEKKS